MYDTFISVTTVQHVDQPGFDVVTLGEPLICLTAPSGRLPATRTLLKSVAGAESNVAIGMARLGRSVAVVTRVGSDPFGDEIVRTLRGEGVDTGWIVRDAEAPTGLMIKERRSPDNIHAYYYRHGSAAAQLRPSDVVDEAVARAARIHVTGITLALGQGPRDAMARLLTLASERGIPVSFDPNFRLKLWSVEEAAKVCTSFLPLVTDLLVGESELLAMAEAHGAGPGLDQALAWLEPYDLASVVVKRGGQGVVGIRGDERLEQAAFPVGHVVDTVGAGDAFNAGYLHALLDGATFAAALEIGCWVASRVVAHAGDYEGLPEAAEYAAHLRDEEAIER